MKENINPEVGTKNQFFIKNVIIKEEILLTNITIKEEKDGKAVLLENGENRMNLLENLEDKKPDFISHTFEPGEIFKTSEKPFEAGEVIDIKDEIKMRKENEELFQKKYQFQIKDCFVDLHRGLDENEIFGCKKCSAKKQDRDCSNFTSELNIKRNMSSEPGSTSDEDYSETDSDDSDDQDFLQTIKNGKSLKRESRTSRYRLRNGSIKNTLTKLKPHKCPNCEKSFKYKCYLSAHLKICGKRKYICILCNYKTNQKKDFYAHIENIYNTYECDICKLSHFKRKRAIELHILKHLKMIYECYVCRSKFKNEEKFNQHHSACNSIKSYKCDECGACFASKKLLAQHVKYHSTEKPFKCDTCDKAFFIKPHLERHKITHENGMPLLKCDSCDYKTKYQTSLNSHISDVHKENPNQCKTCNKIFAHYHYLKIHMRIHSKEKPYECDKCGKKFVQRVTLQNHLRTHEKRKSYKCDNCLQIFSHKQILDNHVPKCVEKTSKLRKESVRKKDFHGHLIKKKKGKEILGCNLCDFTTTKKIYIKKHVKRVHLREKQYECYHCGKCFFRKDFLENHIRIHIKLKPYKCDICNAAFTEKKCLKRHISTVHSQEKEHECKICNRKFSRKETLTRHEMIHNDEKPFQCKFCGEYYRLAHSLKSHESIHKGKPFQCDICKKCFKSKSDLIEHFKINDVEYKCKCGRRFHKSASYSHHLLYACKLHQKTKKR